jgi:hypothetical protein
VSLEDYRLGETNQNKAFCPIEPKICDSTYCSRPDDPVVDNFPYYPIVSEPTPE